MEHKSWDEVYRQMEDPTSEDRLKLDPDLHIIDAIRKAYGLPYETESPQYDKEPPLQGELPDDDVEFKAGLLQVATDLGMVPSVTYNPGCGDHVSLAEAFPAARTIFLDTSGDVQHRFLQHNHDRPEHTYEFYRGDMNKFTLPDGLRADLTLILNAGYMEQAQLDQVVAPGGVVVINDWHGGATYMKQHCTDYEYVRTVDQGDPTNDLHVFRRTAS